MGKEGVNNGCHINVPSVGMSDCIVVIAVMTEKHHAKPEKGQSL